MSCSTDIQVLRNLESIKPEWQELHSNCQDSTPFQSAEWLIPWWRCFGKGDPVVVGVRENNRLIGLGLFYIYDGDPNRRKQLFFLGKGVSDYLDVLVADDAAALDVTQRILDCLFEMRGAWNTADFDRLRPCSPVLRVQPRPEFAVSQSRDGICPELALTSTNMREILSRNTRDSIRKHLNRARGLGKVEFVTAGPESFSHFMTSLVRLHSARWHSAGLPGVFGDSRMVQFICEAGEQLLRKGTLQLQAMLLNDGPIAVAFGILLKERCYYYLCDFDQMYASISPGTLVTAHAIEQAAQRGGKHFDFLRGDEEYKYTKWRAQPNHTYRLQYSANGAG